MGSGEGKKGVDGEREKGENGRGEESEGVDGHREQGEDERGGRGQDSTSGIV